MPFRTGEQLGDYEILRLLGAGGMGEVYQVRNTLSDRVEAMKVLPAALQANKDLQERFLREIKISAALRHPNIAELRTAQRVDGLLVMVMEFVDGVTLDYLTRNGPLPMKNALHYTKQVLDALGFAHERGVIHRDIKPQNVMVTEGDAVRLMDFGIARSLGEQTLTMTGMTLGSLFYMSPEQIRGEEVDGRSDLYSMGILLYEMVTGQRPFQGTSGYTVMAAHLEKAPPPPIERNPDLPAPINALILRALEKDPSARFQNAAEFSEGILALDRQTMGRVDGLLLTRAFEVRAAELPSEAMTLAAKQGSVTQTMPNTPTPGSGRPVAGAAPPPAFTPVATPLPTPVPQEDGKSQTATILRVMGMLVGLFAIIGIFGPNLIRELRNVDPPSDAAVATEGTAGEDAAQTQADASQAEQAASQAAGSAALPKPQPTDGSPSPLSPKPPPPPVQGGAGGPGGERFGPPPGTGQPPGMDEELRQTMQQVEADLKAAGIDMKLFGPEAREGRRFIALERAMQFSEVAKRYGAVAKRKAALDAERREMGRLRVPDANRRQRSRMISEIGDHWRKITESSAAAEAAIESQNLTLAAEKLTIAESELDIVEKMIAAARERNGQAGN